MYYKLPRPKEQHIVCTAVRWLRGSALQCPSDTVILECYKRQEIKPVLIKLKYLKRQIDKTQIHKSLAHSCRVKAEQRVPKTVRSWSAGATISRCAAPLFGRGFQTSVCSAISRASSTSIPKYRTVLSILVWPSRSCTARRFLVRR